MAKLSPLNEGKRRRKMWRWVPFVANSLSASNLATLFLLILKTPL
jgi:hypothetical protein